jgi:hypothetical protein
VDNQSLLNIEASYQSTKADTDTGCSRNLSNHYH